MTGEPLTPGTVAVPGAVLSFAVRGDLADATPDSPPLILCGSPMDSTGFASLAAGIPAGPDGRVLVLTDPRNTGRSTRDERPFTYDLMAGDVVALLDHLAIKKAAIVGWSDGAILGLLLATESRGSRGRRFPGRTFWLYLLLYAVSRYAIEIYRGDPRGTVGMFSTSQFISVILAPLAVVMLAYLGRRASGPEPQRARKAA